MTERCPEWRPVPWTDLTNHDGEREDPNKIVDELEADLKDGGGVRQTSDGDQGLHSEVVTADVTVNKKKFL